ncbi:ribbon-helix-helix domain-containing protein [Archangium primigenium]|uniref:ribbon-helix-helix domain-containing protein n=1 Tax=[Archangium] primigenium TaxID=2792470 RepID=UPI00195ED598|nr:ribbon-helix-helix domain-containing protein [Archangium primigenium]MBM7117945.1 hypothetical protein [Archangium primigenium]
MSPLNDPDPNQYGPDQRLVRVVLPMELIQRVDELLLRRVGGYRNRQDFIRDAVDALVLELSYAPAPQEPPSQLEERIRIRPASPVEMRDTLAETRLPTTVDDYAEHGTLDFSRLPVVSDVQVIEAPGAVVVDEPLFGLHNRDYPSLWLASQLAQATRLELANNESFMAQAIKDAWVLGEKLQAFEQRTDTRLSSLFPTNRQKSGRAEEAFRTFAFGQFTNTANGLRASGPLFTWRVVQVQATDMLIGLTPQGLRLVRQLSGLSAVTPHEKAHSEAFLSHLRDNAPADWWGFETVLLEVSKGATRLNLLQRFRTEKPRWTEAQVSTNVAGYVARAREWGLLESKQAGGKYLLTKFGESFLGSV